MLKVNRTMKRLTVTAFVLLALVTSAVRVPASVCAVVSAPIGKACQQGCCANKACCADSDKNKSLPSQPLVKNGANHELIAILAPVLANGSFSLQSFEPSPHLSAIHVSSLAPEPALLCTF